MTNLIELEKPQEWHSEYDGSKKTGKIVTYPAQLGTIQTIDSDLVKAIKQPLLNSAKGKWGQGGMRYLYDLEDNVYGIVFSSDDERDIHDVFKNNGWQHGVDAKQVKSGMTIYVVPNDSIIKDNPNAIGIKFRLV